MSKQSLELEPDEIEWLLGELEAVKDMFEDGLQVVTGADEDMIMMMRKAYQLGEWESYRKRVVEKLEQLRQS